MATGDPPSSGDSPPDESSADPDALSEETTARRRRSRHRLRVPGDPVPRPSAAHPSLETEIPDTTIGKLPEGFDPEAPTPVHTAALAEHSHAADLPTVVPPVSLDDTQEAPDTAGEFPGVDALDLSDGARTAVQPAIRHDIQTDVQPAVRRPASIPAPAAPTSITRNGSVPPPPAAARPASIPAPPGVAPGAPASVRPPPPAEAVPARQPPAEVPPAAPATAQPAAEGGSSMRVVRRRIIRKIGSDEAVAPQVPETPPVAAVESVPVTSGLAVVTERVTAPPPEIIAEDTDGEPLALTTRASASPAVTEPRLEAPPMDDFNVPPLDEEPTRELRTVEPPAEPPLPELPDALGSGDFDTPTPVPVLTEAAVEVTSETEAPPPSPMAPEDDGVEISLEDNADVQLGASRDPSLAMLDALADLPPDAPVRLDADAVVQIPPVRPGVSIPPPPPPPDASRPGHRPATPQPAGTAAPPPPPGAVRMSSTPTIPDKRRRRMWWEELFNEDYFRTMERFSPAQVKEDADWIEQALGVESGASILDVACGVGRQSVELARRGYDVVALDLSPAMLTRAGESAADAGARVTFTHGDMALMEFSEVFDSAYCVGTSFGFFDDERNAEVARRMHRALKPHGTFLLEVVNRDHAITRQPDMAWFEGDGCVCMEETSFNYITSRLNVKRTMIFEDGRQREVEYSLRLYSLHELGQVLHEAGFRILEVSGHKRTPGAFFGPSSRDLIILAQKRGPEVVEIPGMVTAQHEAQTDPNASRG